jgi:enterochelin esterase-like enzyme
MRDAFRDLLRIRAGSALFRLRTAEDVQAKLSFPHVDGAQDLIVGRLDDRVQYFLNAATTARTVALPRSRGEAWVLHAVHRSPDAADKRARDARFDQATGTFSIPARTAVVFVRPGDDLLPDLVRTTLPARLGATPEAITFDVQLPPGYDAARRTRYPTLYLDDGQDLADVDVRQTLERLYRAQAIHPLIVVAIHMPRDRLAAYGLADRKAGRSIVSHTKYGDVGANAHAYSEWIARTLVPQIDARYRTDGHRAMLGWSLGGIHAFSMGWNYPELFDRVGAFSPSFWLPVDQKAPTYARIAQTLVEAGTPPKGFRAYFAPGLEEETDDRDGDGIIDVVDDAQELAATLRAKGATVDVVPMPRGQHRQHTWAAMLPGFLEWAF